jgi:protein-disulfide isomerase
MSRSILASLTVVLFPLLACTASAREASQAADGCNPQEVVAQAGEVKLTRGELDQKVAERLTQIRQQEYDIRRQAVDEILAERLLAQEAANRKLTPDDLMKEVDAKVPPPAQEEINEFFEKNKARVPPQMSKEEALDQITRSMRERNVAVARARYKGELLTKAGLKVSLQAPRSDVAVPAIAPATGPDKAPVTIVEFSDYQCPYCQRSEPTVQEVMAKYAGKVKLVHRDFPLDGHPRAVPAARAAYCAGEQGKFWEFHRDVLLKPGDLTDEDLKRRAGELGLDATAFATCSASDKHDATIREAAAQGASLGVTGTPTFFINGRMIVGARPIEQFSTIIDDELSR